MLTHLLGWLPLMGGWQVILAEDWGMEGTGG